MKYFFTICGSIITSFALSQSFTDNLTIQVGTALHGTNFIEQGALSLAFHPVYYFNNRVSLGIRYDHPFTQIGNSGKFFLNQRRYYQRESHLKNTRTFSAIPSYHFNLLKTNVSAGIGLAYYQRIKGIRKLYRYPENQLVRIDEVTAAKKLGFILEGSVYKGRIQSGVLINLAYKDVDFYDMGAHASIFFNYSILGKHLFNENENENENKLPKFSLEFGVQPLSNLGKFAGAFNVYVEPKVFLKNKYSVGFRVNSKYPYPISYDKNPEPYQGRDTIDGQIYVRSKWNNINRLGKTHSYLATFQYYIPQDFGWLILNAGGGVYKRKGFKEINGKDIFGFGEITIPAIPSETNIGAYIGGGIKIGYLRMALEYNFTGKNIPDYLALQMGMEIGIVND